MLDDVYYAPPEQIRSDTILLDEDERRHLVTVTRHAVGDRITIVDGQGNFFGAVIERIEKKRVECRVQSAEVQNPQRRIVLGAGLLRNPARFDFLVEKATELGVSAIVPLITERVLIHRAKTERWEKIALSAMKQSGRAYLPAITGLTQYTDFLGATPKGTFAVIPHERGTHTPLAQLVGSSGGGDCSICIGPEGGFTDGEVQRAVEQGFQPVTLGEFRLRAETAAVAAVALCSR